MKLRPFELTLVVTFAIMAILALLIIKSTKPGGSSSGDQVLISGSVEIWGTFPGEGVKSLLTDLADDNEEYRKVSYKYYSPEQFDDELLRALADGVGPDLVLMSQEKLVEMRKRIQPFSYESFPVPSIRAMYLDGAQVFALSDGLYGYPIAADPLMLYWNRDMLANEGFLDAPKTWESLVNNMFPSLVKRDFNRTIQRSVVAMGEYSNVRNAFGIISTLFIQGGSEGVIEDPGREGKYIIKLQNVNGAEGDPLRAAADFYTRFSRPSNALYSWNRSFAEDRTQFISEDLAMYFGYASEGPKIEKINPNLNFDIAEVPQGASATARKTYGKFYALSLLNSSDNKSSAGAVMASLGRAEVASKLAIEAGMVPAHRSAVSAGSNDTYGRLAFKSAAIAVGWLNPESSRTDDIFETMTRDINENRRDLTQAADDVSSRLKDEY